MKLLSTLSYVIASMNLDLMEMGLCRTLNLEDMRNCKAVGNQFPEDDFWKTSESQQKNHLVVTLSFFMVCVSNVPSADDESQVIFQAYIGLVDCCFV